MLLLAEKLKLNPVMSLQTGAEIARVQEAIIDPGVLDVVAYRLSGSRLEHDNTILLTRDIREVGAIGLIIDSAEELVSLDDVIKVKKLTELNFQLVGLSAVDDQKHKLGKIYDYTIDPFTFTIHQLHVRRPLLKSLQTSDLIISRKQIIEINNKSVVVKSATAEEKPVPAAVTGAFINPFKNATPPNSASETKD